MAIASANAARVRRLLGESAARILAHAPLDRIVTKPQNHDKLATSFMIQLGKTKNPTTGRHEVVWLLFSPPAENDGAATLECHAHNALQDNYRRLNNGLVTDNLTEITPAFRLPNGLSKGMYESLAKYYFLEKLASMEQEGSAVELQVNIYISNSFVQTLRCACIGFKDQAESQIPAREHRFASPELETPAGAPRPASQTRAGRFRADTVKILADLKTEEAEVDAAMILMEKELERAQEARRELDDQLQRLEQGLRKTGEDKLKMAARREEIFKDMSLTEAFELGREVERGRP